MLCLVIMDNFSCKTCEGVEFGVVAVVCSTLNHVVVIVNQTYSKVGWMRPVAPLEGTVPRWLIPDGF